MPEQSKEFCIIDADGICSDAALHESMLDNEEANVMSDLMAIESAVAGGMTLETAARMMAGEKTRAHLIAVGLLKE